MVYVAWFLIGFIMGAVTGWLLNTKCKEGHTIKVDVTLDGVEVEKLVKSADIHPTNPPIRP